MLEVDPAHRCTAMEIKDHPWVNVCQPVYFTPLECCKKQDIIAIIDVGFLLQFEAFTECVTL